MNRIGAAFPRYHGAMKLIGMLDSPYVRRVAVSLKLMGVPFEHQLLSVFRTFEEFRRINPVVKAPTLVCDDGAVLMDSTLILDYVEGRVIPEKRLMPAEGAARREALRLTGLALAATAPYYGGYYADPYYYGYRPYAYGYGYPYGYRRAYYGYGGYYPYRRAYYAYHRPYYRYAAYRRYW